VVRAAQGGFLQRKKINPFLLFILLLLGAYVYLFDQGEARKMRDSQEVKKIFNFDKENIREIMLRRKGQTLIFMKEQGQWMIKEPWNIPADKKIIDGLLSVFRYGVVRPIDDHPSDYNQYGLAPPELELGIKARGDSSYRILEIGGNNPNHTSCYARVKGSAHVILIGSAYKTELLQIDSSTFHLQK